MAYNNENIIDVNELNFEEDVIDYSMNMLVIVNFWANWSKPSLEYKRILEKIVTRSGNLRLAHVNIDTSPLLSSQFAVYTLPTLKVIFQGNITGELIGNQPEYRIIHMLNSIQLPDPLQLSVEKADALRREENYADAADLYNEILEQRPAFPQAQFGLAVAYLHLGDAIEAFYILKDFPASKWYNDAEKLFPLAKLLVQSAEGKLSEETDQDAAFAAALRLAAKGKYYPALDALMEILKQNRNFSNGMAHKAAVALIELLPDTDPQKNAYRSELSSILF